jgi:hypothetical protein
MLPLLDLFATADDVFTEDGAFREEHIKKSLGRIYRAWKRCRVSLDPEFDPASYERKPRSGISVPPATDSKKRSSGQKLTSDKNRKKKGSPEKRSPKASAKSARSSGRASTGR